MSDTPHILNFQREGDPQEGYLAITETGRHVPFDIKRTFVTYHTPLGITRGGHAHHRTEMVLTALQGTIRLFAEDRHGNKSEFLLNDPAMGVLLPTYTWHTMQYSEDAIQLVLASTNYDQSDYIRDYQAFLELCAQQK